MTPTIPNETILAFARTIRQEAQKYGFDQIDLVRLINALMDMLMETDLETSPDNGSKFSLSSATTLDVATFPLKSERLQIRLADPVDDIQLLDWWMKDEYGKHFLLSCATAQSMKLTDLLENPRNEIGIVMLQNKTPIGAVAFLDVNLDQRRAELRKVIGESDYRGMEFAEEATILWIKYGCEVLGLEKFYVSTLQTHLRNIRLNESIGFRVEGVLQDDVRIGGDRHDVLRMGLTSHDFRTMTALQD